MRIRIRNPDSHSVADPDPTFYLDADTDPDPILKLNKVIGWQFLKAQNWLQDWVLKIFMLFLGNK
jgi:hypothetical protein